MTYVMSDIHGEYEKYRTMLDKISFGHSDVLYVLGDVIDRGEKPFEIIYDMSCRHNVYPIIGNHELMALDVLNTLNVEITAENFDIQIDSGVVRKILDWQRNGSQSTMAEFKKLKTHMRTVLLDYMEDFAPYEALEIGDKLFILVHSGLGNFSVEKDLDDYTLEELTMMRPDYGKRCFDNENIFIVCGHTPTLAINNKAEIFHQNNYIVIDCGATFPSGRLACLCLETMEEFYV